MELIPSKLAEPLTWRKPQRVFVNSMSDLFHEGLPDWAIDRVFAVMALAGQHTFQVLTKRPERMRSYLESRSHSANFWKDAAPAGWTLDDYAGVKMVRFPLPNVWLGVSAEDQATADERIPLLLETPAAVRFVSYEPALGPVSFRWATWQPLSRDRVTDHLDGLRSLDWVIVGGESGPGARPFKAAWARSVVAQCGEAGVACFVKQLGARPEFDEETEHADWLTVSIKDRKGGDMSEWPEDLRVRHFPGPEERR